MRRWIKRENLELCEFWNNYLKLFDEKNTMSKKQLSKLFEIKLSSKMTVFRSVFLYKKSNKNDINDINEPIMNALVILWDFFVVETLNGSGYKKLL